MDWTEEKAREAKKTLWKWRELSNGVAPSSPSSALEVALFDDLNTHAALSELHRLASVLMAYESGADMPVFDVSEAYSSFLASAQLLGLLTPETGKWAGKAYDLTSLEMLLDAYRHSAIRTKDFSNVDRVKSALIAAGVEVRMSKSGVELIPGPDFDPAKLEALK